MSTAHVAKFAEFVAKNPALLARLGLGQVSDEASAHHCAAIAVKEAKAMGLEFTEEEGYEWIKSEAATSGTGELSDIQLEAVAGAAKLTIRKAGPKSYDDPPPPPPPPPPRT